jgi:hypothetical protein
MLCLLHNGAGHSGCSLPADVETALCTLPGPPGPRAPCALLGLFPRSAPVPITGGLGQGVYLALPVL